MELLLYRWSTAVQASSLLMLAVFFVALYRSVRTADVRWWAFAWGANLLALAITLVFWFIQPPAWVFPVVRSSYLASKTAFVVLLVQGASELASPGRPFFRARTMGLIVAAQFVAGLTVVIDIGSVGVEQNLVVAAFFSAAGLALLRTPTSGLLWLGSAFLLRSLISLAESVAYASTLLPHLAPPWLSSRMPAIAAAHSSFDSGAEWFLALGCLLAVSERAQRDLRLSNQELLGAQEDLRRMADRDPLTGLANRRALPAVLREVQPQGANLLFFDLDGFKQINDRHGHHTGDATLRRFATALSETFRPTDTIVRYAGDEFLVILRDLDEAGIAVRVERLRNQLDREGTEGPPIRFSVGLGPLPAHGSPEAALQAADDAMYQDKHERTGRARAR